MKTSEVLSKAFDYLSSAETNRYGEHYICHAIHRAGDAGQLDGRTLEGQSAVYRAMEAQFPTSRFTTLLSRMRAHGHKPDGKSLDGLCASAAAWWPIRDAWLRALIVEYAAKGD